MRIEVTKPYTKVNIALNLERLRDVDRALDKVRGESGVFLSRSVFLNELIGDSDLLAVARKVAKNGAKNG